MFYLLITLLLLFFIYYFFVSRKLSPVPYFPTNKKDIPHIIKALDLKNNKVIVDLGAGDGFIIFEAANEAYNKNLSNKFYAVEINPVLVFIMNIRRFFHKNKKNIYILKRDFAKMSLRRFQNAIFYLYLSPKYLNIVYKKIKAEAKNPKIISYFYKPDKTPNYKKIKASNNLFFFSS